MPDAAVRPNDLGGVSVICPVHGWVATVPDTDAAEPIRLAHEDCR